jgi:hypothetical protein
MFRADLRSGDRTIGDRRSAICERAIFDPCEIWDSYIERAIARSPDPKIDVDPISRSPDRIW